MATKLLLTFAICRLIVTVGLTVRPTELLRLGVDGQLSVDPTDMETASLDFGMMSRAEPFAVFHPASAEDIARLVGAAYGSAQGFTVSAKGHGHSINGQAQTSNGVVIAMSGGGSGNKPAQLRPLVSVEMEQQEQQGQRYADVWGGELWIDVLRATLEHGLAPKSWTDYLYLSVGGTLSNAGISGQAFNHGPQISNVYELDVVTGSFTILSCMSSLCPTFLFFLGGGGVTNLNSLRFLVHRSYPFFFYS
jgi:cytokinin dehydrogenase